MYNGQPVKGVKGACPAGSTWVEDSQSAPASSDNQLFRDSKIFGNWFDPANYTKFKPTGKVTQMLQDGAITNWADNLQGYIDENPKLSRLDKGMNDFFSSMGMESYKKTNNAPKKANFISANEQRRQTFDAKMPKQPPSKWEQFSANFKDPDWWMQNMSGLPHDTRLHRLGMLMDYYGRTPKGRAAVDMPAEVWARNEQEALEARARAKEAAEKAKPDAYKWSFDDVQEAASIFFDEKFGKDWPFGKDKDESKALFMADLTDSKRRNPQVDLTELAEELMKQYPDRYI